jgi:flagella basal body P-ring formation protein FlgA
MTRFLIGLCALLGAVPALADSVVAKRTIRNQAILTAEDLTLGETRHADGFDDPAALIGLETRQILYANRPILRSQVGAPALVDRNALVTMVYVAGGIEIATEGRALGRGAKGETVRVMNLSSRNTVTARVHGPALVHVFDASEPAQ